MRSEAVEIALAAAKVAVVVVAVAAGFQASEVTDTAVGWLIHVSVTVGPLALLVVIASLLHVIASLLAVIARNTD